MRVRSKETSIPFFRLDFSDADFLKCVASILRRPVAFGQISPATQFIRDSNKHGFGVIKAQEMSEHSFQRSSQTKLGSRFSDGPCNQRRFSLEAFIDVSQITHNTLMINTYAGWMMKCFKP